MFKQKISEQLLIKDRQKRKEYLSVWEPGIGELSRTIQKEWLRVLDSLKSPEEKIQKDSIIDNVVLQARQYKDTKYFEGVNYLFGEFIGKPGKRSVIFLYVEDIFIVNYWQKDLIERHLFYILEHELKHYFGATHEDMEKREGFAYPSIKS